MKKNIALLLGLAVGLGFVSCSSDDDDDENINGEGKYLAEMLTTRYDWKDGKRSDEGKLEYLIRYNEKGEAVSLENHFWGYRGVIEYEANGDVIQKLYGINNNAYLGMYKSEFNTIANADSSYVEYTYNWKDQLVSTEIHEFTYDGKMVKYTEIIDSIGKDHGKVSTVTHSGNTTTTVVTNLKDGSFIEKYVLEYDSHGNVTKNTSYVNEFNPGYSINNRYVYDSQERLIKKYDGDYGYVEYTYNNDGTIHKEHYVEGLNTIDKETYDLEYTYKYKKK